MRAIHLVCALLLVSGCAQKVNEPADVQAVRDALAAWDSAWSAGNVDRLSSLYTSNAVAMGPNHAAAVGKDAIVASARTYLGQFREENHSVLEDVRVSGNLAVGRGTQQTVTTSRAGGSSEQDKAKWVVVFERQHDGSWKVLWETYNSNLPCR